MAYIFASGLLFESDVISLSNSVRLGDGVLEDAVTNARHQLHPDAQQALGMIVSPVSAMVWVQNITNIGINERQIFELIEFLGSIGGLTIARSNASMVTKMWIQVKNVFMGIRFKQSAHRYAANLDHITRAVLVAMTPLILAIIGVAILGYAAGLSLVLVLWLSLTFITMLWMSTVFHENTHARIFHSNNSPTALIVRGMSIGILHGKVDTKTVVISALAGPLVGAGTSFIIGAVSAGIAGEPLLLYLGIIVAIFHLANLLPSYGDGRAILRKFKEQSA